MSIDKFGRYNRHMRINVVRGPTGEGFRLTDEGDYDIDNKRLCNVGNAVSEEDAVSFKILKENCLYQTDNQYDVALKNIINLADPKLLTDAATKSYVDTKIPTVSNGICNFEGYRLNNIGYPSVPTDAVSKQFILDTVNIVQQRVEDRLGNFVNILNNHVYSILYDVYVKTTKDNPVRDIEDWKKNIYL